MKKILKIMAITGVLFIAPLISSADFYLILNDVKSENISHNSAILSSSIVWRSNNPVYGGISGYFRYSKKSIAKCDINENLEGIITTQKIPLGKSEDYGVILFLKSYSLGLQNLEPDTLYNYCSFAQIKDGNNISTIVSEPKTFKTLPPELTAKTDIADEIRFDSAILNGSAGEYPKAKGETTAYLKYSRTKFSSCANRTEYAEIPVPLGVSTIKSFQKKITGLSPDTTYYFCVMARNTLNGTEKTAYGEVEEFSTPKVLYADLDFKVATRDVNNISHSSAVLNGSVEIMTYPQGCNSTLGFSTTTGVSCDSFLNAKGNSEEFTAYFRYSKEKVPPIYCNDTYGTRMSATEDIRLGKISGKINFSKEVSGLSANTKYYYCAIVSNKNKIYYGDDETLFQSFTTLPTKTSIKTLDASSVTSSSAVLNGYYNSARNVKTYFQYAEELSTEINAFGISQNISLPPLWISIEESTVDRAIGKYNNIYGNFKHRILNLKPDTKYMFRAVAEDDTGITEGLIINFRTEKGKSSRNGGNFDSSLFPQVSVSANPSSVSPGGISTISWRAENATSCRNGNENLNTNGSFSTGPLSASKSFAITCTGTYGKGTGYTYVYVGTNRDSSLLPKVTVTANPSSISPQNSSTISWSAQNATSCDAGTGTSGSFSTGPLSTSKSFAITCTGTYGNGSGYAYVYVGNINGDRRNDSGGNSGSGAGSGSSGGILGTPTLVLGQKINPPADAIVRFEEGIETVFSRQIKNDVTFAKMYGYKDSDNLENFSWVLAHEFARAFGYVNENGREIRVSFPDVAAYQLQFNNGKLTIYEYYSGKIIDVRTVTPVFKSASGYEYYFKK